MTNAVRLFSFKAERMNLLFPLFFAIALAWELLTQHTFSIMEQHAGFMLAKGLFLNHFHVFFTVLMFVYTPEAKQWLIYKTTNEKFFAVRWVMIFVSLFAIFYFIMPYFWHTPGMKWANMFAIATVTVVGIHHVATQTFGLSLVYNRRLETTPHFVPTMKLRIKRLEFWERIVFRAMLVLVVLAFYLTFLAPKQLDWINGLSYASLILAIVLTVIVWSYPGANNSNKKIFCVRYLFYPLIAKSFVALLIIYALHGIEYLFVLRQMHTSSEQRKGSLIKDYIGMTIMVVIFALVTILDRHILGWWLRPQLPEYSSLTQGLMAFSAAYGYLHCHMDSEMFRMRDPASRKFLAPLLLKD